MKKNTKNLLMILLLSVIMVFPMNISDYGATTVLWTYSIIDDKAEITGYSVDGPKRVEIPNILGGCPVTRIADYVFYKRNITSVSLPETVTSIGQWAFAENELTSITLPANLTELGEGAFMLNYIASVDLPLGLSRINYSIFSNNNLATITLPKGIQSIGYGAFSNNRLISVSIPDTVTEIGNEAFSFNRLTVVNLPSGVVKIGDRAFQNNRLLTLEIPDAVVTIGAGAFSDNDLTSVVIGNGVQSIGNNAFYVNKLKSISIPRSVTSIQETAFEKNDGMSIKGLMGSAAEIYAKNHGLRFSDSSTCVAISSKVAVTLDNNSVSAQAYNIDGNNYFRLRDIAMGFKDSVLQFDVLWDGSQSRINLQTEQAYTPTEEKISGSGKGDKTAHLASVNVAVNGKPVSLLAYNIDGSNYFKLRDLGLALGFKVFWDNAHNTIRLVTNPDTYTVKFDVLQEGNGLPYKDAVVIFNGIARTDGDFTFTNVAPGKYVYEVHFGKNLWTRHSNFIVTGDCAVRDEGKVIYDFSAEDIVINGKQLVGKNYGDIKNMIGTNCEVIEGTSAMLDQNNNLLPVVEMVYYGFTCFYQTSLANLTDKTQLAGFETFFPDIELPLGIHTFTTKNELINRFYDIDLVHYRWDQTSQEAKNIHHILNTYANEENYYASPDAAILYGDPSITGGKANGLVILINEDQTVERIVFGTLE